MLVGKRQPGGRGRTLKPFKIKQRDFLDCVSVAVLQLCRKHALQTIVSSAEVSTHHSLEAGVQLREEGRFVPLGQDPLLHHRTLNVVILDHHVLLQDLDGIQLLRRLHLREHHLRVDEEGTGQRSQGNTRDGGRILKRQKKCFYVFMSLRARRSPCRSFPSPAGTGS